MLDALIGLLLVLSWAIPSPRPVSRNPADYPARHVHVRGR
jgi:hypothetical protein